MFKAVLGTGGALLVAGVLFLMEGVPFVWRFMFAGGLLFLLWALIIS